MNKPESENSSPNTGNADKDSGLAAAAASAAAAMFGVQSSKAHQRDFQKASPGKLIFMGAVMVCVFVTCVLFAVRCSLEQAGMAGN
ncbi:DUF2970 domain-containing protein [Stagnimonas aquatica]|uniref:DUF2970 domain-containing protein n=1 Tax=Stagnimonas aquatica TaxID=2689987 RepID=A0A3N0VDT9_9GAMM|nr:DUF2970 domain-containing protein [Stagnimonas aquatica]ROH90880.1 DUF2970 domain-containing protein [Stagnimonas aquatica]